MFGSKKSAKNSNIATGGSRIDERDSHDTLTFGSVGSMQLATGDHAKFGDMVNVQSGNCDWDAAIGDIYDLQKKVDALLVATREAKFEAETTPNAQSKPKAEKFKRAMREVYTFVLGVAQKFTADVLYHALRGE
ncbi:MAG: hypothetical protein LBN05_07945 [Oscillospiraceae bacterium]|jgi:hypothetical protein|nr:hypothetical protein [Oscillospiraceae bacterium]